ncbi:putative glycoside hydrolase subgroup catalytic core [Venturia nashicola]|uniref:Putative glycoside hydrolase subgroup catalytic core n=1 Tax=Venturia nashicola TaxID=86259 RepID=A0A4Z1P048_9PEZI|nr:putative glycoside hydrolase subgroup catalytic core [Venturia nashicola]
MRSGGPLVTAITALFSSALAFNNPPGVDIWCGKAYRPDNASFSPGGWLEDPAKSSTPLLDFKISPRMNIYLESDTQGSFLVDASISNLVGQQYPAANSTGSYKSAKLSLEILINGSSIKFPNQTSISVDTVKNEIVFSLGQFPATLKPYNVTIYGTLPHSNGTVFTASTKLYKLPDRTDGGSVTRLDNLYGGLSVRKGVETKWSLIFPFTYYVQWTLYWNSSISTLDEFAAKGYNVIHIVPTGDLGDTPFPWDKFEPYLKRADQLGLYFQYDVRWEWSNLTTMIDQVTRLKSHPSILLWYIADEPDGKSNPINSTAIGYNTIRSMDLYHPVSMALNCYNFYYSDYAAGADIILTDVYPIGNNNSYSTVYKTPCNATYGCCGCDDCDGVFEDISNRLDNFAHFDDILGWSKTHWAAPQAFGNETFWTRFPTAAEEVVMNILSINHAAKGVNMWDFPTSSDILAVTNRLAKVLTTDTVAKFLLGAPLFQKLDVAGATRIDVAVWVGVSSMLLSVVNLNYGNLESKITVTLPKGVKVRKVTSTLWGNVQWTANGDKLNTNGLMGLEVSLVILELE